MRRIPTCVLSDSEPPSISNGHAFDRFVQIGSLTKVLTGTALMRLAAAGALTLDDPVERWLPAAPGTGITLRQLADHTSASPGCRPRPPAGTRTRRSTTARCATC
jgi:CubicO group peptidase (beta-lactamase class C family)